MTHPWLQVPLADYEAHMAMPSIGQAALLGAVLGQTLAQSRPSSLAVLGVAGGNGLDEAARAGVRRVVALDFNPEYLARCTQRFAASFETFKPVLHDLSAGPPPIDAVDCVFAGLVLEYLRVACVCAYLPALLVPRGRFAALLQLPATALPEVSASPYTSLERLGSAFAFVDPEALDAQLAARGFARVARDRHDLPSGKSFLHVTYQRM